VRKLIAALLVVGMLFSTVTLTGCGKKDEKKSGDEKKSDK
jgi:hypothetical protein